MELVGNIHVDGELSAVLIRKDDTVTDLGIISGHSVRKPISFFKNLYQKLIKSNMIPKLMTFAMFMALLIHPSAAAAGGLSLGLVTTTGVNYMASDFASGGVTPTISGFKFHDCGTGSTAAAIGDTALQTAAGTSRVSGTASNPSANQYRSVATISFTSSLAITEWGLFSASSTGTMWDHRVFSAINVGNGDSIQFTYTLTVNAGGS